MKRCKVFVTKQALVNMFELQKDVGSFPFKICKHIGKGVVANFLLPLVDELAGRWVVAIGIKFGSIKYTNTKLASQNIFHQWVLVVNRSKT